MNDTTRLSAASALEIIQSLCHVNSKSIFQLTNGISNDLKKLLTYFKGTTNFTLLTLLLSVPLISFDLNTKLYVSSSTFALSSGCSSLLN